MKFIHCADLHLDSKIERLPTEKSKLVREETVYAFERLADYASKNGVKAVIISGDLFDSAKAYQKTCNRILQAVTVNSDVDFIFVYGNHDLENNFSENVNLPENFKIVKGDWQKFSYENVDIYGISLLANNAEYFIDTLVTDKNKTNIVAFHTGYNQQDKQIIVPLTSFKDKNIDYIALGHIHFYQEINVDERCTACYSGCLSGRGFDETDDKGFVLLDVENNKVSSQFVPFSTRNYYAVEYNVDGKDNFYALREEIVEYLKANYSSKSLIKLILKGERKIDFEIDKESLSNRLNQEFFFGKVYDETRLKISLDDFKDDKSVKGEFVRLVLDSKLDEETKQKVINCGLTALKGEII